MRADEILSQGVEAMRDRAATRDAGAERSMERTVRIFNALTGRSLTEEEGWQFMVCLKLARSKSGTKVNIDDYIDGAAYFALAGESVTKGSMKPKASVPQASDVLKQ